MRRLYKKLMSSVLLLVFLLNLLPTAALAAGPTGSGTESDPYVYEVATADDLRNAVEAINADTSGTGHYVINIQTNIDCGGTLSFTNNTTTILGNEHTMCMDGGTAHISASGPHTVVNFGVSDGSDTLVIDGNYTDVANYTGVANRTMSLVHVGQGAVLNMYDGVTICHGSAGGQAGGVQLAENSQFNMHGGTITDCINRASVAGGVLADDSSTFYMHDGTISNCSGYQGGGVGVIGSANFIMDGGTISGCEDKWYGGGGVNIFGYNASFTMNGGIITNCTGTGTGTEFGYGGAVFIFTVYGSVALMSGEISGSYGVLGGGLFVYDGAVTVSENVKIYNNQASKAGDDIYNNTGATLTLKADPSGLTLDACSHVIDGWYIDGCKDAASTSRWSISPCSSVNADYAEKYTVPDTAITAEIALKAAHGSGHTVTFDTQGGSTVPSQTVFSGTAV